MSGRGRLRALRKQESDYLNPPLLSPEQIRLIYGENAVEDERERRFGQAAFRAIKRVARASGAG